MDFDGWTPGFVLGVQFVDNGGGGGRGDLVSRPSQVQIAVEAQNQQDGGFDWHAGFKSGAPAAYDTWNMNAGEFEFAIPWSLLGLPLAGTSPGDPMRIAAYTTQNLKHFDAYDSAPGLGNAAVHEALGDDPDDPDDMGQLGATDFSMMQGREGSIPSAT